MSVLVQESLLDVGDEPVLGPLGGSVRRTVLAGGAWVDLRRGWLTGSGAVFGRLVQAVPWRAGKRQKDEPGGGGPPLPFLFGGGAPPPCPRADPGPGGREEPTPEPRPQPNTHSALRL